MEIMLREIFLNLLYMTGIVTLVIIMFQIIKVPFEIQEKKQKQKELDEALDKFTDELIDKMLNPKNKSKKENNETTKKN